jgi:NAD(P)-dependent dehydrogenase (short-subunit alcohol dehydrogenase family)
MSGKGFSCGFARVREDIVGRMSESHAERGGSGGRSAPGSMGQLDGKRALVTGGASGIGLATVRRFIDEGATVVIVDLNEVAGKQVADEVGAEFVRADVADGSSVSEAFRQAHQILGGLDIAYMNAGVTTQEIDITKITDEQYFRILNINVNGVFFGVREAARLMKDGGAIVATASIAGLMGHAGDPIYTLTKHAVVGLCRSLAQQLGEKGITINAICPGITDTPLVGDEAKKFLTDAGFPLIPASGIAEAVMRAITSGESGNAWVIQPGREPMPYAFRGIPGPRAEGAEGMAPPSPGEVPWRRN